MPPVKRFCRQQYCLRLHRLLTGRPKQKAAALYSAAEKQTKIFKAPFAAAGKRQDAPLKGNFNRPPEELAKKFKLPFLPKIGKA